MSTKGKQLAISLLLLLLAQMSVFSGQSVISVVEQGGVAGLPSLGCATPTSIVYDSVITRCLPRNGFSQPIIADGKAYAATIAITSEVVAVDIQQGTVVWRTPVPTGGCGELLHGAINEIIVPILDGFEVLDQRTGEIKKKICVKGSICSVSTNGLVHTVDYEDATIRCYACATGKLIWQKSLEPGQNPINADVRGNVVLATITPSGFHGDTVDGINKLVCLTADAGELIWQTPLELGADMFPGDVGVDDSATRVVACHHDHLWLINRESGKLEATKTFSCKLRVARFWGSDHLVVGYRSISRKDSVVAILSVPGLGENCQFKVAGTNEDTHSWGVFGNVLEWDGRLVDLKTHKVRDVPYQEPDYFVSYCNPPIEDMKIYFGSSRRVQKTRILATRDIGTGSRHVFFEEPDPEGMDQNVIHASDEVRDVEVTIEDAVQGLSPAKIDLSADKYVFSDVDAPITLHLKFTNTSTNEIALCPNRIDCQNALLTVVNKPGTKPVSVETNWYVIPQIIADYYHGNKEQYVILKPGDTYSLDEKYFGRKDTNLKHLLDFAGAPWPPADGKYIVRVYFWGKECPVFNAPADIKIKLLNAKIVSNEIELTLKTQ